MNNNNNNNNNNNIENKPRFLSLDVVRGLAIVLMIEVHIAIIVPILSDYSTYFAAPFFVFIAGISFQLFLNSRIKKGLKYSSIYLEAFWRGILLFLVTISITIIGFGLFSWYYNSIGTNQLNLFWTVFEIISIGYLLGILIYKSYKLKLIAIFIIFTLSYLISYFNIYPLYFLVTPSSFSITMICFFLFGQLIYPIYNKVNLTIENNSKILKYVLVFLLISLGLLYSFTQAFVLLERTNFIVFLSSSIVMLFIVLMFIRFLDIKNQYRKIFIPLKNIGKIAFTSYYLHVPIIILLKRVFMNHIPPYASNLIILLFTIAILVFFERIWRKYNYVFGLEWILRKGATSLTKISEKLLSNFISCIKP